MSKSRTAHFLPEACQMVDVGQLIFGDVQPSEPLALVRSSPKRRIALPKPPDLPVNVPITKRIADRGIELRSHAVSLAPRNVPCRSFMFLVGRIHCRSLLSNA